MHVRCQRKDKRMNDLELAHYIIKKVAKRFGHTEETIKEKCGKAFWVEPRKIAIYYIRKYTDLPSAKIGELFNQDHSTILINLTRTKPILDKYKNTCISLKQDFQKVVDSRKAA